MNDDQHHLPLLPDDARPSRWWTLAMLLACVGFWVVLFIGAWLFYTE